MNSGSSDPQVRVDPVTGAVVRIVPSREARPDRPQDSCPFCVGGIESPDPYVVRSFPNRWPSLSDGRCEVVLYGPEHGESLASLGVSRARLVVDLWAERTAQLGSRPDVDYVLCFENHGPEVGATIAHPHGQVWAYPDVPPAPANVLSRLAAGAPLIEGRADLIVVEAGGWRAWVPAAPVHPHHVRVAPLEPVPDLPSLDNSRRDALANMLVAVLGAVERLFDSPMPYMLWWAPPSDRRRRVAERLGAPRGRGAVALPRGPPLHRGR